VTRTTKSLRQRRRNLGAPERHGIALWRTVADELERAIAHGDYEAGARLPGEMQIAASFRVNRHTVRRAIAELSKRGLLRAERGSGTYVESHRIRYPIRARTRFSEIIGGSGREASGRVVESGEQAADNDIARRLKLDLGAPVIRLELIRHADKVPLCVATSWLSSARFPGLAEIYAVKRSMTRALAHFGVADYSRASTHVTAAIADLTDSMRLALRPGSPLLVVDSVDVDHSGRPLLTTRTRFAAERVELLIEG
jgi:GntR family phosphonate transport system transcriptional regulator